MIYESDNKTYFMQFYKYVWPDFSFLKKATQNDITYTKHILKDLVPTRMMEFFSFSVKTLLLPLLLIQYMYFCDKIDKYLNILQNITVQFLKSISNKTYNFHDLNIFFYDPGCESVVKVAISLPKVLMFSYTNLIRKSLK